MRLKGHVLFTTCSNHWVLFMKARNQNLLRFWCCHEAWAVWCAGIILLFPHTHLCFCALLCVTQWGAGPQWALLITKTIIRRAEYFLWGATVAALGKCCWLADLWQLWIAWTAHMKFRRIRPSKRVTGLEVSNEQRKLPTPLYSLLPHLLLEGSVILNLYRIWRGSPSGSLMNFRSFLQEIHLHENWETGWKTCFSPRRLLSRRW